MNGRPRISDDVAYILPMGIFLLLTQVGVWWPQWMPVAYIAKTILVAILLVVLWPHFTRIRWTHAWLGVLVGIIGIVQWVGMEKLILHFLPNYPRLSVEAYNPFSAIASPGLRWTFIAIRLAGAVAVVPFMEELFWRDYLWRTIAAPNNFKMIDVGEWDPSAIIFVTALFASVHVQWLTALVWGAMIAALLIRTRSLGACIIAHAVTNLLLGLYVLHTHDWYFW